MAKGKIKEFKLNTYEISHKDKIILVKAHYFDAELDQVGNVLHFYKEVEPSESFDTSNMEKVAVFDVWDYVKLKDD